MTASGAERELRSIFQGDEEGILKCVKTVEDDVKNTYLSLVDEPFLCLRGAGSLGIDVVASRGYLTLFFEVKSSKSSTIYLSSERLQEQKDWMFQKSVECRMPLFYAYRKNSIRGERWEVFIVPSPYTDLNFDWVPKLQETRISHKMDWGHGIRLSNFIKKVMYYTTVNVKYVGGV